VQADYRKQAAKWYKSKQWQQLRSAQLTKQPYCQCPHHKGKTMPANVVDHITPHRGNKSLFFNVRNLQSMLKRCHDKYKQSQEKGGSGFMQGCDEQGNPLSAAHDWYS